MKEPIPIELNKHICIFFQPRSGSTALRSHLTEVIPGLQNLQEFFNLFIKYRFEFKDGKFVQVGETESILKRSISDKKQMIENRLAHLDKCTAKGLYSVFTAYIQSYFRYSPELTKRLMTRPDVQYFYIERADLLTGILSLETAGQVKIYHNYGNKVQRKIKPFEISISRFKSLLDRYLQSQRELEAADPNIRRIYYEEFQTESNNMNLLFTGIPERQHDIQIRKFEDQVDYRENIININELENYYYNFVSNNINYFPQYCGKVPQLNLPLVA